MACPAGQKSWKGECLTPEEVQKLGPALCRTDETWYASREGCVCKFRPLMKRDGSGKCVANPLALGLLAMAVAGGAYYYARK